MNMSPSTAGVSSSKKKKRSKSSPRNTVSGASTSSSPVDEENNGLLLGPCFGPLARHMVPDPDTFERQLNGGAPQIANNNENRKSKKKKEKISNDRRPSKEEYLRGWSGNFPNLTSTHSGESNSDLEQQMAHRKRPSSSSFKEGETKQLENEEVLPPKRPKSRFSNTSIQAPVLRAPHNDSGWSNISNAEIGCTSTPHTEADWSGVPNAQIGGARTNARSKSLCVNMEPPRRTHRFRSMCASPAEISGDFLSLSKPEPKTPHRRKSQTTAKLPATDEFYKKPFQFGWKRELVMRRGLPVRGDVFFISPAGKKLRSRDDIIPLLQGDLTIDHFCFQRESQGVGPEFELVRQSQPARRKTQPPVKTEIDTPPHVLSGKRVPKPKAPKGASPPPEGWTSTMAVKGNARVLAASNGNNSASSSGNSARKRSNLHKVSSHPVKTPQAKSQVAAAVRSQSTPNSASVHCVRCQSVIEDPHEGYKLNISDSEGVVYICVRCAKKANAEERQPTYDNAENEVAANEGELHAEIRPLPVTEPIEKPGQEPPAQLLSDEQIGAAASAAGGKRTPKPQELVVITGRKYVSVSGEPPHPSIQVIPREPEVTSHENNSCKNICSKELTAGILEYLSMASKAIPVLRAVLLTLNLAERKKVAQVCQGWRLVSRDPSIWQIVSLRNTRIKNWSECLSELARQKTRHLDMWGVELSRVMRLSGDLRLLKSLRTLRTDICDSAFIRLVIKYLPQLQELRITTSSRSISLEHMEKMVGLRYLHIRMIEVRGSIASLQPILQLGGLTRLSLRGVGNMRHLDILNLHNLPLESLVLGSCTGMPTMEFGRQVLPRMHKLKHLRLENRHSVSTEFPVADIMAGIGDGTKVERLELVNVDIDEHFSEQLNGCKFVRELLLMPNYINNAANTTNAIMQAISENAERLVSFKLGLTVELLRMTGTLCHTDKDKHCIPVVRPIPGVMLHDRLNDVPKLPSYAPREWAFLPVERLESILHHMMPQAITIVAQVPHSETMLLQF
ncbi:uncharacterized protein LOC115629719 isoform X2 [Scaptodrosophila lebanonensis]|uniref:Uncharacterized protein LOC115629719 isoform X2 n=1 Tax=Drosophila lebanonensis TaxID=7225 RepID=A0A6J2U2I4_DROLE|nr:uncharacterized protein LOC115629719 isoform X2 [Scaptodrosophila lebanonensis]